MSSAQLDAFPDIIDPAANDATGPAVPAEPVATAVAVAAAAAVDHTKIDLTAVALAHFGDWRGEVKKVNANLSTLAVDLSTQAKVDEHKSLRWRLIGQPRADARKVAEALKKRLGATSKAVGTELDDIVKAWDKAEDLITPKIEAAEAKLAAEKAERARIEAERVAAHQAKIDQIRSFAGYCVGLPASRIQIGMEQLQSQVYGPELQEFVATAEAARTETLAKMRDMLATAITNEAAAAALEAQRVENARIAAEHAARQAEIDAQAARLAEQQRQAAEAAERLQRAQAALLDMATAPTVLASATSDEIAAKCEALEFLEINEDIFGALAPAVEAACNAAMAALAKVLEAAENERIAEEERQAREAAIAAACAQVKAERDASVTADIAAATADNNNAKLIEIGRGIVDDIIAADVLRGAVAANPNAQGDAQDGLFAGTPAVYASSAADPAEVAPSGDEGKVAHAGDGATSPAPAATTTCAGCTVCTCDDPIETSEAEARPYVAPKIDPAATITIGAIKNAIAPLSIDAAGLISLGFQKQSRPGPAAHFLLSDWPAICTALWNKILAARSATFPA